MTPAIYHESEEMFMPMSDYLQRIRRKVGNDLLMLPSAAVAIYDQQGRILLCLHRDKNIWVMPGGLVEPGEQPADAAVREAWEETGLLVELTGILGVYGGQDLVIDYPNGDRAAYIGTIFYGQVVGGSMRPDGEETLDVRYFSPGELESVPHAKWLDTAKPVLFAQKSQPHFVETTWKPQL
jgi:8-oxo-dGTP pyrophosphatase MutT (NUDIX family)